MNKNYVGFTTHLDYAMGLINNAIKYDVNAVDILGDLNSDQEMGESAQKLMIDLTLDDLFLNARSIEEKNRILGLRKKFIDTSELYAGTNINLFVCDLELSIPDEIISQNLDIFNLDKSKHLLFEILEEKLKRYFKLYNNAPGFHLFLDESYSINVHDLQGKYSPVEVIKKIIQIYLKISKLNNRKLLVSTFTKWKFQQENIIKAINLIEDDGNLIVGNWCTPSDWGLLKIINPAIGKFKNKQEVIFFDFCGENWGQGRIPFIQASVIKDRLKFAKDNVANLKGFSGFVSWNWNDIERTPQSRVWIWDNINEINYYIAKELFFDSNKNIKELVNKFLKGKGVNGEDAVIISDSLLKTFDIVFKSFHVLDFWVIDWPKSQIPTFESLNWSFWFESLGNWDKKYKEIETKIQNIDDSTLNKIINEKEEAVLICKEVIGNLRKVNLEKYSNKIDQKVFLEKLIAGFELEFVTVKCLRYLFEMFYRTKFWWIKDFDFEEKGKIDVSIVNLEKIIKEVRNSYSQDIWPPNPDRLSNFINDLSENINLAKNCVLDWYVLQPIIIERSTKEIENIEQILLSKEEKELFDSNGKKFVWEKTEVKSNFGYVETNKYCTPYFKKDISVFLKTTLNETENINKKIRIRSEHGAKVWVNNKLVFNDIEVKSNNEKNRSISIELKKGENDILVRLYHNGCWDIVGFIMHIF